MKILSLDQATNSSGIAVFSNHDLVKYDLIKLSKAQENHYLEMVKRISEYINNEKPDIVIFEDVSLQRNVSTLILLAQLQGAIMGICIQANIPYIIYKPSTWRKILHFQQKKGIKRPELKRQAKEHVYNNYGYTLQEDICDAICIGTAYIKEKLGN